MKIRRCKYLDKVIDVLEIKTTESRAKKKEDE